MDVSLTIWATLVAGILAMLLVDLFMHRDGHEISVREAALWSGLWVAIGIAVGVGIWLAYGAEFGMQYFAGYVIEKSLAVDNVFVWAVIFSAFLVPRQVQHRVLFYGVVGALVFRAIFIALGSVLIASFSWILYVFGAFLIVTGIKMMRQRNEHIDPSKSRTLAVFRRLVPMTDSYDGQKFWARRSSALIATPLLAVLVLIEVTDIIFAVDSIPAIFAVTQEPFLVFASNALAILGLRAMYFLLADLIHRFVYLKLGLSVVLAWVGVKMIVSHAWIKIPTLVSLSVVVAVIAASIIASLISTRSSRQVPGPSEEDLAHPFQAAVPSARREGQPPRDGQPPRQDHEARDHHEGEE
ncbi:MAG: TerC family protein [Actinomycetales bacterium]|nr:TerC family protein [Actinomycetales bacterium]